MSLVPLAHLDEVGATCAQLDDALVATVAYADIFDVAIDETRLHSWLVGPAVGRHEFEASAERLVSAGRIGRSGSLCHLPGRRLVVDVHRRRERLAHSTWPTAIRWGRRLGRLPFVRMVAVTGGLACNSMEPGDDIDYLVITESGRVWTTRALIAMIVRFAALQRVELCPNYVLAEDSLELADRNVYVARELVQMQPVVNPGLARQFRTANRWLLAFVPNADLEDGVAAALPLTQGSVRRAAERLLRSPAFDPVERWEMRRRSARLLRTASRRAEVDVPPETSFTEKVCKGHLEPNGSAIDAAWSARLDRLGVSS